MDERACEWCRELYRPRVPDQRFCSLWCRHEMKAAEGRAARFAWRKAGRPMIEERVAPRQVESYRRY
jgi:hypothetical protein